MIVSYHYCRYMLRRLDEPGFSISGGAALHQADSLRLEKGSQHFWEVCVWGCTIGLHATLEVRNLYTLPSCSGCGSFFLGSFHVTEDWFRADRKREYPFFVIGWCGAKGFLISLSLSLSLSLAVSPLCPCSLCRNHNWRGYINGYCIYYTWQ